MFASLRRATHGDEICLARVAAMLVAALLLTACGSAPPIDPGGDPGTPVRTAEALSQQGRHEAAADLYQQQAMRASGEQQERYLILTARERYLAGTPEVARNTLERLEQPIHDSNRLLWALVSAEISISMGDPARALANLDSAPRPDNARDATNLLLVRSDALFRLHHPVAATSAMLEREVWLEDPRAIAANQRLLWDGYQTWGVGSAAGDMEPTGDPIMTGWLALGEIAWTRRTTPTSMQRALTAWQDVYPSHPANQSLVPSLVTDRRPVSRSIPRQVAVLLPLTGRQRQAAVAVRDGFLAAHFVEADLAQRPTIRVYDVSVLGAQGAYDQAIADGATFVVGPLLKESVQALATRGVTTPTLTLNFLPENSDAGDDFYQFALSPEDEARQVAQRAADLGQLRALALAPNNEWGRRLLTSFMTEFQARGGTLLDYRFFDPGSPDFSGGIQQLLLIDESRARKDRLTANLSIPLEYEPRRRSDIDLIFLAATDTAGKLIRPQLRFHYAGAVPTYSTSAIYQEGTRNNSDLNGIMFPDIPWIIAPDGQSAEVRETLNAHWPGQAIRRARLYALGFDAYRLIPTLNSSVQWNEVDQHGMTGTLYIDEQGRVLRRLAWARITQGRPELMEPAPDVASPFARPTTGDVTEWPGIWTRGDPPSD